MTSKNHVSSDLCTFGAEHVSIVFHEGFPNNHGISLTSKLTVGELLNGGHGEAAGQSAVRTHWTDLFRVCFFIIFFRHFSFNLGVFARFLLGFSFMPGRPSRFTTRRSMSPTPDIRKCQKTATFYDEDVVTWGLTQSCELWTESKHLNSVNIIITI